MTTSETEVSAEAVRRRRLRLAGIILMSCAVVMFACLDTIAKYLTAHMDQLQVAWARYASAFLFCCIIANPLARPQIMRTQRPVLQIVRGLLLCGSTVLNFIAMRYIQLDEATAIMFSGPFIIAAVSGPLLGEWIGPRRWAAIAVGFLGVLFVTRPGFSDIHPTAALSMIGAVCYASFAIVTRVLSRSDSDETTLFYSNLAGAVLLFPILPFVWSTPSSWLLVLLMAAMGVFAGLGHYLLIMALRRAPASVLSPFMYGQLVWVIVIGYAVFGHLPNRWSLLGVALIVASGLYLLHRERVRRGQAAGAHEGVD